MVGTGVGRRLYLHIGRGKTGTSSIQRMLANCRSLLLDHGIHYVFADDEGRGAGHQRLGKSFIESPPAYMSIPKAVDVIKDRVAEEIQASDAPAILMSSEHFAMGDFATIRDFFLTLDKTLLIQIIYFVRSQDELAESEYNQMVKLKREHRSFTDYTNHAFVDADYFRICSDLERVFGLDNLHCRIYDSRPTNLFRRFFSCIENLDPQQFLSVAGHQQPVVNQSLGYRALSCIRTLNRVELENRAALYQQIITQLAPDDLPALQCNSHEARRIRERFANDNLKFSERYLGSATTDLGHRRYTDERRDAVRDEIVRQL